MPKLSTHCAISKKRTGERFEELHRWTDEPWRRMGRNHRLERHTLNDKDLNYVKAKWGEKGAIEWLFHIALDNVSTCYKLSKKRYGDKAYNQIELGLFENGFVAMEVEYCDEADLADKFELEYIDDNEDDEPLFRF